MSATSANGQLPGREFWTVGHWTCPEPVFLAPLLAHDIGLLADVRSLPGSRRSPQFDSDQMRDWLADAGIGYVHLAELGGRRRDSGVDPAVNAGWHNASFHRYADYTLQPGYRDGIRRLGELAATARVVIMCGEPMPWRCHRSLIATTLTVAGCTVWHLIGMAEPRRHVAGQWGAAPRIGADGQITYPASAR